MEAKKQAHGNGQCSLLNLMMLSRPQNGKDGQHRPAVQYTSDNTQLLHWSPTQLVLDNQTAEDCKFSSEAVWSLEIY